MTSFDKNRELTDLASAEDAITALTWEESDRPDRLGLELEAFPVASRAGRPEDRLPLNGVGGVTDVVDRLFDLPAPENGPVPIRGRGYITYEPGGQIEYSSTPHSNVAALRSEVDLVWDALQTAFFEWQVRLVCLGIDPWHDVAQVPQQLRAGRYVAMDQYFSGRWPAGAVMMRNTCSLQVNLESGSGTAREERWLVTNLISPILTAMFTTSPGTDGTASRRAKTWQAIDPTRTGLPTWRDIGEVKPEEDTRNRALRANVMFVDRDGQTTPIDPGWSFAEWVRDGHPEFGQPTITDLQTHLSTLFPEVRPRAGTLELRGIDALPRRWWIVPVVVAGAIVGGDRIRSQVIDLLSPIAAHLPLAWRRAADQGLKDPELAALAGKVSQLALDVALSDSHFDHQAVEATEGFLDRFTMRGRAPGDELRPLLAEPRDVFEWALADPVWDVV